MKILKFGGSSVSAPERIRRVIEIIKGAYDKQPQLAVVVSAFGGVTDELIALGEEALVGSYGERLQALKGRHYQAAEALIAEDGLAEARQHLGQQFHALEDALRGVELVGELSKRSLDFIASFGERLSAYLISVAIKPFVPPAIFLDAREVIKTDNSYGNARVDFDKTYPLIREWFSTHRDVPIVTGFIGSTTKGDTTTLGRGGSDYTASVIGAGVQAEEIEIWTDVDGVMTADPKKVESAFSIPQMSYKEALEMSHFGAKVIHPPTIAPALSCGTPLRIRNTFHPDAAGTLISAKHENKSHVICGLSSIDKVSLLRVEGSGMVGVCGTSMRLFGALARREVSVILISQGSSEHSICFAVAPQQAEISRSAIEEEFALERHAGLIDPVIIENDLSIVAAVGENMRQTPGIAGRLFGALGKNGVNVIAIAQGSSEYNISIVIRKNDEAKALNVIHEEFFLSPYATLHVFIVGTGLIGSTLLAQMEKHGRRLKIEKALNIRVVGVANSQKMAFRPGGFNLSQWKEELASASESMDIQVFVRRMRELNLSRCVFVDCTASEEVASVYPSILAANISIVTPNKKANSGTYEKYKELKALSAKRGVKFLYEANVGAGLPIISTVIDLLSSGDKIEKIEAILSGTLSYLFNTFQQGGTFSQALRSAQKKGFTEPDPREDLNGSDVMRKLLILARESGYPLELSDIKLESLLPPECFEAKTVDEFYERMEKQDPFFEDKKQKAALQGKVLRYIASFDRGKTCIGLHSVDAQHPFYYLSGSDNIISILTERYHHTPLVIKGQGAGAEVTAGVVFADIIKIAAH